MRFIGSKANLLNDIDKVLSKHLLGNEQTFLDLFAGTNSVGNYFKNRFSIISNDLLYFSYINAKATIENNGNLKFNKLNNVGISSPIEYLNSEAEKHISPDEIGYYEQNYSPSGGAMYITRSNAKRIDFIRDKIDEWKSKSLLEETEYYYLLSCLIQAIPRISNITGTYGAYLKHWDKRSYNKLELIPIDVVNNNTKNICYNENANILIKNLHIDIAYIDTPYNNRQYASNYHILENVARNNKPKLSGKTKIFDWSSLRSEYSTKSGALKAMEDLIKNINATHIVLSYSNEGIITENQLIDIIQKYCVPGTLDINKIPYRKYKSKIHSDSDNLYEMIIYFQKETNSNVQKNISSHNKSKTTSTWKYQKIRNDMIKSPLNYIGGKYKLLNQIIPFFPEDIDTFVDLFSGGANVGINARAKHYVFNDMNTKLNEMFRLFSSSNPETLISNIKARISEFNLSKTNREAYIRFRDKYNKSPNPLDLYILISYGYNYQIRFNSKMKFNNPFGLNRSCFNANMENNLKKFIERLKSIDSVFTDYYFENFDYSNLTPSDFVYLDPPYLITTGSYNDGNRGFKNWGETEEKNLYNLLHYFNKNNIRFALSNVINHKGKTNKLLKNFIENECVNVHTLNYNYDNASHNSKKHGTEEVLVTNYN